MAQGRSAPLGPGLLANDATPRAIVDVTDPDRATIVALNVPAEFSAAALGLSIGQVIDPLILADPFTRDEATAKFLRLLAGEVEEYQTFGTLTDVWGDPVALRFTVRLRADLDADRTHLEVAWHDITLPEPSDHSLDEEVLDVAQLITHGALADAPIGVALVDIARNVYVTANRAYAALLGMPRRELVDRGTEVGRPAEAPLATNAHEVMALVRGTIDSITMTLPVPGEAEVVDTVTLHPVGERDRNLRFMLLYMIRRVRTVDQTGPDRPILRSPMPDHAYARAVVDADWRLQFIEPPLESLGVDRGLASNISVLPSVNPADLPSLLVAADLVRSGSTHRSLVRARYRVLQPTPGYLATECEITQEAGLPAGWLVLTNTVQREAHTVRTVADRLRDITHAALLEEDDGGPTDGRLGSAAAALAARNGLTPRELEILRHLVDGYRVSTIARALHLSDGTVRNYLSSIFRKFGVRNQAELLELIYGADGR